MRLMTARRPGRPEPFIYWCFCKIDDVDTILCGFCAADIQRIRLDQRVNRFWRGVFRSRFLFLMPLPRLVSYAKKAGELRDRRGFECVFSAVRQMHGKAAADCVAGGYPYPRP
jgi:hypothetical protein